MRLAFAVVFFVYWLSSTYEVCQNVAASVPPVSWWYLRPGVDVAANVLFRNAAAALGVVIVFLFGIRLRQDQEFRQHRVAEFSLLSVGWLVAYPVSFILNLLAHL
jgi:hypothetical protein